MAVHSPNFGTPLEKIAERCKSGDAEAWEELISRTHRIVAAVIRSTLGRWGARDPIPLDDLIQDVYLKLSANRARGFAAFEAQHPRAVLAYVKATAASVAHDYYKSAVAIKRGAGARAEPIDDAGIASADPAPNLERALLLRQVADIISEFPARDRTIFWLYYRQGLAASAIARIPAFDLTSKGVESCIARLTRAVRDRMAAPTIRPKREDISAGTSLKEEERDTDRSRSR